MIEDIRKNIKYDPCGHICKTCIYRPDMYIRKNKVASTKNIHERFVLLMHDLFKYLKLDTLYIVASAKIEGCHCPNLDKDFIVHYGIFKVKVLESDPKISKSECIMTTYKLPKTTKFIEVLNKLSIIDPNNTTPVETTHCSEWISYNQQFNTDVAYNVSGKLLDSILNKEKTS